MTISAAEAIYDGRNYRNTIIFTEEVLNSAYADKHSNDTRGGEKMGDYDD